MKFSKESNLISNDHKEEIIYCLICYSENSIKLNCNCQICEDCLFEWVSFKNYENLNSNFQIFKCPNHKCSEQLSLVFLQNNLSIKNMACINEILYKKYLNSSLDVKKCSNVLCQYAGWVDLNKKCTNALECELCENKWIDPSLRTFTGRFLYQIYINIINFKEIILNNFSELNVLLMSKPCNKCGIKIYKFEGCDHMRCLNCSNEFCYNCVRNHGEDNLATMYCNHKYFFLCLFFGHLFLCTIYKILSNFYYPRTILYFILYFIGLNLIALLWNGGGLFLGYLGLFDVINSIAGIRSPETFPLVIKIFGFIFFIGWLSLTFYYYINNTSVFENLNFLFIEYFFILAASGFYFLIKKLRS